MERIVLEVDDATGKAYRKFSDETKQSFNRTISAFLKKAINDSGSADYQKMLDNMGDEAVNNGLTPEILKDLLHNND